MPGIMLLRCKVPVPLGGIQRFFTSYPVASVLSSRQANAAPGGGSSSSFANPDTFLEGSEEKINHGLPLRIHRARKVTWRTKGDHAVSPFHVVASDETGSYAPEYVIKDPADQSSG
ncbi:hypothetical protein DUNSADRAFT_18307 [Dunaliella salina]|uniref:Encoded protein n=1 Tax=Dunaliella salina TaxID=3046 RepID=A0ABQ7GZ87_DUNSA|nr:hypothetical protein DUNSADRAFT_18307 [Dunaliella salina]|eukprot:KAF5839893.1 hypothetical protein DUNSADRAFT_18307 [Dunaliella salina]